MRNRITLAQGMERGARGVSLIGWQAMSNTHLKIYYGDI